MSLAESVRGLMITSGKGGVGKSTISIGTALALCDAGQRVGLLDVDVRAPNVTYLLGMPDGPCGIRDDGSPVPADVPVGGRRLTVLSPAMMFRPGGSILTGGNAFRSYVLGLLQATAWPEIEWLVIDMDPAPGDSLRAVRDGMADVSGVVVTTPDRTSLEDARRMLDAFETVGVRTVGVVLNQAWIRCHACGAQLTEPANAAEVEAIAAEYRTVLLAQFPWDAEMHRSPVAAASGRFAGGFRYIAAAAAGLPVSAGA